MKLISKESYTTTILYVEYENNGYMITHSEDYDDVFTLQWRITDEDGEEIKDIELVSKLKEFTIKLLNNE
jgi:hypothetical protein